MNILLAFDPGVSLGYSAWDISKYTSGDVRSALLNRGVSKSKPKETDKDRIRRIFNLCNNLIKLYGDPGPITVVAEDQFYLPGASVLLQRNISNCHQVVGFLKVAFIDHPFETVKPSDWQGGLLCGLGKMKSKEKSLLRCKQFGIRVNDHNESDAILIGVYVLDHMRLAKRIKEAG